MQDKFGAISERCIKNPGSNFDVDTIFLCATFAAHRAQQIVVNDKSAKSADKFAHFVSDRILDHSPGQAGDQYPVTRAERTKIDMPEWADNDCK
ncbi:conserved hypothetical protein [Trichinella spiralis]|uniref:hypothetical protein n=1 Tax=Trichinella spiralis TaxID=6334 RepID=UPI0001EFB277|nr:conserved hypothetical protein [Trichinella spiralis]